MSQLDICIKKMLMKREFKIMQTGILVIAFRKGKLQMDVLISDLL